MFQVDPASIVEQSIPVPPPDPVAAGSAVIISTRGRPDIVAALVKRLGQQTRPP
jgi:hypothetical protein